MPEPATPADDRCLAGLTAALTALPAGPLERVLAGFADALMLDAVVLLGSLEPATIRVVAGRRLAADADPTLPSTTLAALADGRPVHGGPELAAQLVRALGPEPAGSVLIAPLSSLAGPPTAALAAICNLSGWTWTFGQEHAVRGLAGGLAGWLAARGLQQVLDALPQRIAWKDGQLRVRGANRAHARQPAEPDDRREREVLTGGPAHVQRLETAAMPGGREQWSCVTRVALDGGGLVITRDDITAPVALAGQLAQAHRTAAIGRLAAGVGADLRPLVAEITADVALARRDPTAVPAALDRIDVAVLAADDLARQLALFARRQLAQPADVVPTTLLGRMEPTLGRLLGERIELHLSPAGLRCVARVDPRLFEQLLALLARHVRDLLGGRGRLAIDVAPDTLDSEPAALLALAPGEYVRVHLLASPGPPRQDDAAFEAAPPVRGDPHHSLGLALVRAIAGQVGGAVLHTTDGEGNTHIEVHLPRVFSVPRPEPESRTVTDVRGNETLLLVEDDPVVRPLLTTVLRHLGYHVLATADLPSALQLADTGLSGQVASTRVALALVSTTLPGQRAPEVLRQLRRAAPDLRVLWIAPGAVAPATPVAASEPLVVPCSFEALAVRVRQALDART